MRWDLLTRILETIFVWTARGSLLSVLAAAPWWFGGVELDVQATLTRGVITALVCWTFASVLSVVSGKRCSLVLPILMIPLSGMLLLGAAQICPWKFNPDSGSVNSLAEESITGNRPTARALIPEEHRCRSIYPAGTRVELARLGIAIVVCFLGVVLFRDTRSQVWLWGTLTINGATLAFFGIVQQLSWNGKLFWTVPLLLGGQPFASFVNRNNAAGYLNLCLACAAGLIAWSVGHGSSRSNAAKLSHRLSSGQAAHPSRNGLDNPSRSCSSILECRLVCSLLLTTVIAAGIICSMSRGGVLAMLVSSAVLLTIAARTRGIVVASSIAVLILGLGTGLVCWVGMENRFLSRWSATEGDTLESGMQTRLANWNDALSAASDFPVLGTGYGTYSFAYLPYQSSFTRLRFYNADNQFVETLVESGILGLGLALASIGICLLAAIRLLRSNGRDPAGLVGVTFVVSQIVSACFDFGPTMTANMLTLAVLAGAVTGRAATLSQDRSSSAFALWLSLPDLRQPILIVILNLALTGHAVLGFQELSSASACRNQWRELPKRLDVPDAMTDVALDAAIRQLSTVVETRPDDADAQVALARLWLYRYRIQAYQSLKDYHQHGGPAPKWGLTEPLVLYHRAQSWNQQRLSTELNSLRKLDVVRENLAPAYRHLLAARTACPLMPGLDLPLATTRVLVGAKEESIGLELRRAIALSPQDVDLLETCATMAQSAGLARFAKECLVRSAALDANRADRVRRQLQ